MTPLHNLVFVLVALAALLAGEFNRRGQGWRLLGAVGLAVAFQAFTFGLTSVIVNAAFLTPVLYLGVLVVGIGAGYVLSVDRVARPAAPAGA